MAVAGINQKFWAKGESVYDTPSTALAATHAFDGLSMSLEPDYNFEALNSHVGTGSLQNEIAGMKGGKWSVSAVIAPRTAGTAPNTSAFFTAAFGTQTIGGSSVTYTFSDANVLATSIHSLRLVKYATDDLNEVVAGAWIEQFLLELQGGQMPKLTASGGFSSYGYVYGTATVNGAHAGAATAITVTSGHAPKVSAGVFVKFGTEDNSGAGYYVSAKSGNVLTISPGLANGLSGGESILPLVPSQTLAGTQLGGVDSNLTIDGTSLGLISAKLTINTGIKPLSKQANASKPIGIYRAERRKVEGTISAYFSTALSPYVGAAWDGTVRDIAIRFGPSAGPNMTINLDAARIGVTSVPFQDAEVTVVDLPFVARQYAAAADECNIVFA